MADFSKPVSTDTYANVLSYLKATTSDLALGLDPATTSPTNVPTNAVRWSSVSAKWQKWNGTTWNDLASSYAINISGTAAGLSATLAIASGGTGATTAAAALVSLGERTGANGSTKLPSGTSAQRDGSPSTGFIRFNTDLLLFEGYNGSAWTSVGGGIADGSVTQAKIADGSVTQAKIADGAVTPAKLSTGGPAWDTSGNFGVGTASPGAKLDVAGASGTAARVSGTGSQFGIAIQSTDSSASAYRMQFLDYRNENGVPVVNNGVDVNTDGSSEWFVSTTPAGARNSYRGVEGLRVDVARNLKFNSGYGSVAIAYGCRAWVNFNGTGSIGANQTIRGSGGISSVYKNGTGDYTINFANAMPDANYAIVGSGTFSNTEAWSVGALTTGVTTTSARVLVKPGGITTQDLIGANIAVFR